MDDEILEPGDLAEVVNALGRHKSPNLGLTVTVGNLVGYHTDHGFIYKCTGEGVKQLADSGEYVQTNWADFPRHWLKKIKPPKVFDSTTKEKHAKT